MSSLPTSLIKEFVKMTDDSKTEKKQTQLYGTVHVLDDGTYVQLDGSDMLTPVVNVVDSQTGDRVLVTIENHTATVLGNYTYPPSQRDTIHAQETADEALEAVGKVGEAATQARTKAEEAIEQADAAKNQADQALEQARSAKSQADQAVQIATDAQEIADTAQEEVNGVKASVTELETGIDNANTAAQNAQSIADQAKTDAATAKQAADKAQEDADAANEALATAKATAESAIEKAEIAQGTADEAQASAASAQESIQTIKDDVAISMEEIDNLSESLDTYVQTMEADYARKTDVSETTAHLQSQISSNAAELQIVHTRITTVDETVGQAAADALTAANEAQRLAGLAQDQADTATADAAKAQTAADDAKKAADKAQEDADIANQAAIDADAKAAQAAQDLATAQQNLANVTSRVDSTEEEIQAAQQAVTEAQNKADAAKAVADAADKAAEDARGVADAAAENATNAKSQADQAVEQANAAKSQADQAVEDAGKAKDAADQAVTNALAAQNTANEAAGVANEAQTKANEAAGVASEAQNKANEAAGAAASAQSAATAAQNKADQAAQDLATAEQNLETVKGRVDATEEEIQAAQQAVTEAQKAAEDAAQDAKDAWDRAGEAAGAAVNAQTAADNAKKAADNAQDAADAAKEAADKAQEDANALAIRVTQTETDIIKNSELIALTATKEEVATTLGGYYTKTEANAAIEVRAESILNTVSSTYQSKDAMGNYSTTSQMNSAIEQKASSILSTVSSTYQTKSDMGNYSTTTQMNSAIEQKASGILSTVSSTYATQSALATTNNNVAAAQAAADAAQADIDNFEVGGRNYIILSKLSSYLPYNSKPSASGNVITTTRNTSATSNKYLTLEISGYTPPNEYMTLSGYVKVNGTIPSTDFFITRASTYGNDEINHIYDTTTGYFEITQKYPGNSGWIIHAQVNVTPGNADVVTFTDLKFEKGTTATDWTPAPEDMATVVEMNSAIEQKADSILSTVSGTYQTISGMSSYPTTTQMNSAIDQKASSITSTVSATYATKTALADTEAKAASAKAYTDNAKNNYGYQYKYDITINGDSTKYYPVVFRGGNQNVMRDIFITRSYSEKAPQDWAGHPSVYGISLLLKIKCNFGGWGGANYRWVIEDLEEMYGNVFASAGWNMSYMAFEVFLRGGGTTGAIYHIYSDQELELTYMGGTSPQVCYNQEQIGWSGGTSDNPTYKWNASAPRTLTDDIKTEINGKRYASEADLTSAETRITQTENSISSQATQITNLGTNISAIEQTATKLTTRIESAEGSITTLNTTANGLSASVTRIDNNLANNYQKKTLPDTRNDNQNPGWYITNYPQQVISEFKYTSVIGLSGETYCVLETVIPWPNNSGGYPKQHAKVGDKEYWRVGTSDTAWGAWNDAAASATAFMSFDATNYLLIGNKTSGSWSGNRAQITPNAFNVLNSSGTALAQFGTTATIGLESASNVYIDSETVNIRKNGTTLSTFAANSISLAKNSSSAEILLCGETGKIKQESIGTNDFLTLMSDNTALNGTSTMMHAYASYNGGCSGSVAPHARIWCDTYYGSDANGAEIELWSGCSTKAYDAKINVVANTTNPYINLSLKHTISNGSGGKTSIDIVPETITLSALNTDITGKLTTTGELFTESNIRVNGKTINDLNEGIFIAKQGYMQIQRLSGSPYIDFIYSAQAASCGRVGINASTKYMEFTNSTRYTFDNSIYASSGVYIDNYSNYIFAKHPTDNSYRNVFGINSNGNLLMGYDMIGYGNTLVYGNTVSLRAENYAQIIGNANSEYPGTYLQVFREQSGSHRNVMRPAINGYYYLGTSTYRFNTAFFANAITASDLKEKEIIDDFDFKIEDFIMGLKPIAYRRKGSGDTGRRIHMGFGAQDVDELIRTLGLGDMTLVQASVIEEDEEERIERPYYGEDIDDSQLSWGLNYNELSAPVILMLQYLYNRVKELEAKSTVS